MYRYIRKGSVVHGMTYRRSGVQVLDHKVWQCSTLASGYYVSNMGRVRNVGGCILKQRTCHYGSRYVSNSPSHSKKYLGPLVATEFVTRELGPGQQPAEGDRLEVRHIDGDKSNNTPDNLLWVTNKEKMLMHHNMQGCGARYTIRQLHPVTGYPIAMYAS